VSHGEVRKLARPSREGIAGALIGADIVEPRARALARDSARNLAVLRRLIPSAPGRLPAWAQEPPPRALLAALLAGAWDDASEADKASVSELAGESYEQVVAKLAPYIGEFDSPLRKLGSTWRIASPPDAWLLLAPYLTVGDVERFQAVGHMVLGSTDPRFDMAPGERWMASVHGVHPDYSERLRHGVGEVLILLALWGDKIRTVPDAHRRADAIVSKLLRHADQRRWWSLSRDFRLLAEASPGAFLSAIEDSLDQSDPPIRALFGTDDDGLFGTEHLSDLLWALESLAWSPELLPLVSLVLARLDAIDNPPGRSGNRPANSLRQIHLLWLPQTYATLDQRLRALDLIRKRESNAAWTLMLGLLPRGHDTSSPSSLPRWRDFTVEKAEPVTLALIGRGAAAISERLLADVDLDAVRWHLLLDRLADMAPDREAALVALEAAEPRIDNKADRMVMWASLRQLLHRHRMIPGADWAMPSEDLNRLERVYDRFAPPDPLEQVAWLFDPPVHLPKPSHEGWEAELRDVNDARRRAALAIFASHGANGILDLARLVSSADYIGKALFDAGASEADLEALMEIAVRSGEQHERDLAQGLIISMFPVRKEPWAGSLIAKAREQGWGDLAVLTILQAIPQRSWTWHQAAQAGEEIERAYWSHTPAIWIDEAEAAAFAVRKLIAVGRARRALHLAGRDHKVELPSDLLVAVLAEAASQPANNGGDTNEPTMFQYHVVEILGELDRRADVDFNTLAGLEWTYLPLLEHSQRSAKILHKALSETPSLFVQMVSAVFRPSEESGVVDPVPPDPTRAQAIAHQAYRLLELWNRLPGTREDATIDGAVLEAWIKEARALAKAAGREEIADSQIGKMLSASPMGSDDVWPAEVVRDVIDLFRSTRMINGFWIGKSNRRGVTTRLPRDGGNLERTEAAKYRKWSAAIIYDHPHTARALDSLAGSYEHQAHRQDEDAERLDWEP
ncbi:MAG: hypothetical protein ACREE4_20025, partial [Stellaceae bacterium]